MEGSQTPSPRRRLAAPPFCRKVVLWRPHRMCMPLGSLRNIEGNSRASAFLIPLSPGNLGDVRIIGVPIRLGPFMQGCVGCLYDLGASRSTRLLLSREILKLVALGSGSEDVGGVPI